MKPAKLLTPALLLATLAASGQAAATGARVEALQRDPFQPDETDVYRFPGVAATYADTLLLEFSPSPLNGYGTVLLNRPWTIGLSVHRPRDWNDLEDMSELYGWQGVMPAVEPIADLILGAGFGGHGVGLLFGVSAGLDSDRDLAGTTGTTAFAAYSFDAGLGYSTDVPFYRGDTGLHLAFHALERQLEGGDTVDSNAVPSFLAHHRSLIGPDQGIRLGVDLLVTRRSYGVSLSLGDETQEADMSRWLVRGTIGPQADILPGVVLSGGLAFGYEWLGGEVAGDEQTTLSGVMAPGVVASVEAEIFHWLQARAGMAYDLVLERKTNRAEGEAASEQEAIRHGFSWSVGLGLRFDRFRLDGMVAPGFLFQGPAMVGGGSPGLLSQMSGAVEF